VALFALVAVRAHAAGIDTPSNILPPLDGRYLSIQDVHAQYGTNLDALKILLKMPAHQAVICRDPAGGSAGGNTKFPDPVLGPHETEDFCSEVEGTGEVFAPGNNPNNTGGEFPVVNQNTFLPNVKTIVLNRYHPDGTLRDAGTFLTEMVMLDLQGVVNVPGVGTVPFMIRESPSLPSTGQTTITNLGGGMYHIDSFFDVFTELSIDGGNSWIPSVGPNRMELVPEPSSVALAACGALGLVGVAVRNRRRATAA
jgi:hypothetical protein